MDPLIRVHALGELMNSARRIVLPATASLVLMVALVSAAVPSATPFTIHWTAPGDDGLVGRASAYDLRYSDLPITAANFRQATPIGGLPLPAAAGTPESMVVSGLSDNGTIYLAIESADEAGNWSGISNLLMRRTATASVDLRELSFSSPWPNPARVSVQWSYSVPQPAAVQVDVFDAVGRHVRNVASGVRGAGGGELSWDLRDGEGRPVGAGIYFVRARLGSAGWTKRLVVVR
jgi:hypothetical protein